MFTFTAFPSMRRSTLDHYTMRGSPLIIGLQWLALNRQRIPELLG